MSGFDPKSLQQTWPRPSQPKPIVIIGAGDIVRDAHLPAYKKAGFPVAGVFDLDTRVAEARAKEFNLHVFKSIKEATSVPEVIFDVATPPKAHEAVLEQLPDHTAVMIQKPLGYDADSARRIRDICRRKHLKAAVNFQLRFSPFMLAIRDLVQRGELGDIVDVEVRLNLQTPWDVFPFLQKESRVEILFHSVHHLDMIRCILGNPRRAFARTVKHPRFPKLTSARSSILLDYGDMVQCCLSLNHCHAFGTKHTDATFRFEGTEGCAIATLGLLMDYPHGRPEKLDIFPRSTKQWMDVPLVGSWFPDGFIGTMSNLQRFASGEDKALLSPVEDGYQTMRVVEACYLSSERGGIEIESIK